MKPGRPFGLSLAIIASVMLFTILPLMQVSMVLIVQYRLQSSEPMLQIEPDSEGVAPIAMGGNFTGVDESALFLQTLLGLMFLLIAVFTWVGRPRSIRFVFMVAVVGLTLLTLIVSVVPLLTQTNFQNGIDSGADLSRSLLTSRILLSILIPLYVTWYINRAPARAFFRGTYLPDPIAS